MPTTRSLITRLALPLVAAGFVLTACGSTSSGEDALPSAAMTAAPSASMPATAPEEMIASQEPDEMEASAEVPSAEAATAESAGAYITLAEYERSAGMYANGDVVLFFNATWCPTCQEATKNLESDPAAIPAGLTVVKVDYDDSDELRQKYGVTTQHTFVQVDVDGNEMAKWSGSVTADEIAEKTA